MVVGVDDGAVVVVNSCALEVGTGGAASLLLGGSGVDVGVVLLDGPDIYSNSLIITSKLVKRINYRPSQRWQMRQRPLRRFPWPALDSVDCLHLQSG